MRILLLQFYLFEQQKLEKWLPQVLIISVSIATTCRYPCLCIINSADENYKKKKRSSALKQRDCMLLLLLIILSNKENMPKIPSAYKPYSTIWLYNAVPHWCTALSTDYYFSLLWWCHIHTLYRFEMPLYGIKIYPITFNACSSQGLAPVSIANAW